MNNIAFFGDSYGAGAELFELGWKAGEQQRPKDTLNFAQLIGKNYNSVCNFSQTGASIKGYINQLHEFNKLNPNNNYTLVVMITQHVREYVYDNQLGWCNIYPNIGKSDSKYSELEKKVYDYNIYPQTSTFNWYNTLSLIQHYCKSHGIQDVYVEQFNNSPYDERLEFLIDRSKIYSTPMIKELFFKDSAQTQSTLDWKNFLKTENYKTYFSPGMHPNILGHQIIANRLEQIIASLINS